MDKLPSSDPMKAILPKSGIVYSEKGNLTEVLCKPKIMPIKSVSLEKLEELDRKLRKGAGASEDFGKDEAPAF
eukprot:g2677.t1